MRTVDELLAVKLACTSPGVTEVRAVRGSATASRARDSSMLQCAVLWRESPRCASDGPLLAAGGQLFSLVQGSGHGHGDPVDVTTWFYGAWGESPSGVRGGAPRKKNRLLGVVLHGFFISNVP